MTFLAIQAPYITRRCGLCGRSYLKDGVLEDDDLDPGDVAQASDNADSVQKHAPRISVGRLLFAVCDRCIFCGGKFIG
jgi:hypothetical protein